MHYPKYFSSPYPFQDILLFYSTAPDMVSKYESVIPRITAQTDLQANNPISSLRDDVRLLASQPQSGMVLRDNGRLFLSGLGRLGSDFFFGERDAKCLQGDASYKFSPQHEILGIFTSFRINKHHITIFNDFFGFGHLWYIEYKNILFVTNNYHLLLIALSEMGIKLKIDYGIASASLFTDNVFFQQNFTHEMVVIGIKQLLMDSYISIGDQGLEIKEYTPVLNALQGKSDLDVHQLVDAGIEEIKENVHCVYNSSNIDSYVMDLSGGKDSRIILAALLQDRNLFKKTKVRTKDMPNSNDLAIASGLLDIFGGEFVSDDSCPRFAYDENEALDIWRSYFMGQYHQLAAFGWSTRGMNNQLRLTGACGELYRNFWNNVHRKVIDKSSDVETMALGLLKDSRIRVDSAQLFMDSSIDTLINSFERMPADDYRDKLEQQYIYFRTRHHFGFRGFQFFHEGPVWYPLMSPSLLTSTWKAPLQERNNGLGIFYITEQLNPILPWIEYDGNYKFNTISPEKSPIKDHENKCLNIHLNVDTSKWSVAHKKLCESMHRSRNHTEGRNPINFDEWGRYLLEKALEAIIDLKEHDDVFVEMLSDELVEHLRRQCTASPRTFRQYCSKIISLRDQVYLIS